MTISRVKPAGWGIGEKLTSAQQNSLDTNVTYALDKRLGETDDLESIVSCQGEGRIVPSQQTGADADTTYTIEDTSVIWIPDTLTADRAYTLDNGAGELEGDEIAISCDPGNEYLVTVKNHDGTTIFIVGNSETADGTGAIFRFDGTDWKVRLGNTSRHKVWSYTASGTWTCPRGVTSVRVEGVGAGGGGGGGAGNASGGDDYGASGGGGGGARLGVAEVTVIPGTTYTITIGTGGAGGAAGAIDGAGGDGSDGSDTTFDSLVTFRGAGGGKGGAAVLGDDYAPGGVPIRIGYVRPVVNTIGDIPGEGEGGWGVYYNLTPPNAVYRNGGGSAFGAGGSAGSDDPATGGGGGGRSGYHGTTPGAGGVGSTVTTTGNAGSAGTLGSGGGGGSTPVAVGGPYVGGAGGAGGNGALRIIYVK